MTYKKISEPIQALVDARKEGWPRADQEAVERWFNNVGGEHFNDHAGRMESGGGESFMTLAEKKANLKANEPAPARTLYKSLERYEVY